MAPNNDPQLNKLMMETIISGLEQANESIKGLQTKVHSSELSVTEINSELKGIRKDLSELIIIIRGNNSKETLVNRVLTLENDIKSISEYVASAKKQKTDSAAGQWQFKAAVFTGAFSLIGTAISLILNFIK